MNKLMDFINGLIVLLSGGVVLVALNVLLGVAGIVVILGIVLGVFVIEVYWFGDSSCWLRKKINNYKCSIWGRETLITDQIAGGMITITDSLVAYIQQCVKADMALRDVIGSKVDCSNK